MKYFQGKANHALITVCNKIYDFKIYLKLLPYFSWVSVDKLADEQISFRHFPELLELNNLQIF